MNQMGTKIQCACCSTQLVVTRGGAGTLACHNELMVITAGLRGEGVANQDAWSETVAIENDETFFA